MLVERCSLSLVLIFRTSSVSVLNYKVLVLETYFTPLRPITFCADAENAAAVPAMAQDTQERIPDTNDADPASDVSGPGRGGFDRYGE